MTFYIHNNVTSCDVQEGDVVTDFLGLTKYEPPIPIHMAGEVDNQFGRTLKYDIENFKKYPDVLIEGENVVMTEKLHGTWCCFGYHPDIDHPIVTSKGLSDRGLIFKLNERNEGNLYVRALNNTVDEQGQDIIERAKELVPSNMAFYLLGEVYGPGVQDLHYGAKSPQLRVFDVFFGNPESGRFLNYDELKTWCHLLEVDMVPELYVGPFSKDVMEEHTNGRETVSGKEANIREGIVIKPLMERQHVELGRVILKSVSEAYLLRKGNATEYN